jgi:acetyl-CoA carboxylase carboxyl transferase subunit alpha
LPPAFRHIMAYYLEFEKPLEVLAQQLDKAHKLAQETGVDMAKTIAEIAEKISQAQKDIYQNLNAWQRVQLSRHQDRPYTLAYIEALTKGNFIELHGDRQFKDDKAMVGGWGDLDGQTVMFIGQQKGINTKMRQYRNFGMPNPEGYRKANRLMKMAEKFGKPIVTFIDTPGAFPGLEAEERGQGEAIAKNLLDMMQFKVPIVCIIIGEGASGGALGIGIGDKVLMLENTWYSVISPESCSSILWRSWENKERAAEALKLTPEDMLKHGLIDGIIAEPLGGAHRNPELMFEKIKETLLDILPALQAKNPQTLVLERQNKFCEMGKVIG